MTISVHGCIAVPNRPRDSDKGRAERLYGSGVKYLCYSSTARQIIEHFYESRQELNIIVDMHTRGKENLFYQHEACRRIRGNCVLHYSITNARPRGQPAVQPVCTDNICIIWCCSRNDIYYEEASSLSQWQRRGSRLMSLFNTEKKFLRSFGKKYKNVPHTYRPESPLRGRIQGTIPAPITLIHEMGHAMQYTLDTEKFLEMIEEEYDSSYQGRIPGGMGYWGVGPPHDLLNVATIENQVCLELRDAGKDVGIRWLYGDHPRGFPRPTYHTRWASEQ